MSAPPTRTKRVVAALLPAALLWVFAACLLICGWENAAADGDPHSAVTLGAAATPEAPACEGCPDASFLKAATAERRTFRPESQAVRGLPASTRPAAPPAAALNFLPAHHRRLLPDTPLELRPALRI